MYCANSCTMPASTVANFAPASSSCENGKNSAIIGAAVAASFLFLIISILLKLSIVNSVIDLMLILSVIIITLNRERNKLVQ